MRVFSAIFVISLVLSALGCGSSGSEQGNVSTELPAGVTQPPPPDPNKIAGNNPRDPQNRKPRPINPPGPPPEPMPPRPGAENSEVSAMMNEDGSITEFRIFKDHPLIEKAEATWMDPREKSLKVFLKSGKVLEAKTDKIPYLHEAPSELILSIVGAKGTK